MTTLPMFVESGNGELLPGPSFNLATGETPFDAIKHIDADGSPVWYARELQPVLEYKQWRRFENVIDKAIESCEAAGFDSRNHFADVGKMVNLGDGAEREIDDLKLSYYACRLIAMNGDPRKRIIAEAQAYFVGKTAQAEHADKQAKDRKALKKQQDITAYQLAGHSQDWSQTRVAAKEALKRQNAAIRDAHVNEKPNYGNIGAKQNAALFDKSKQEIVEYLGLLPKDADEYRDRLGKWAHEAVRIAGNEIARQMNAERRQLTDDEIARIVVQISQRVAEAARVLADLDHVDYLSGADLDDQGNALISRNVRLLGSR